MADRYDQVPEEISTRHGLVVLAGQVVGLATVMLPVAGVMVRWIALAFWPNSSLGGIQLALAMPVGSLAGTGFSAEWPAVLAAIGVLGFWVWAQAREKNSPKRGAPGAGVTASQAPASGDPAVGTATGTGIAAAAATAVVEASADGGGEVTEHSAPTETKAEGGTPAVVNPTRRRKLPALAKWLIGLVVIAIPVASLFYVFTREGLLSLLPLAAGAITGAGGAWLFEDNRLNLTRAIVGLVALTVVSAGIAGIFVVTFPTGVVRFGDSALPNGLYAVVGEQGDFTYLTPCSSVGSIKSVENTEIQAVSFVNHRSRRWPTPYGAVVEHRPAHFGAATDCPPIESRRSARR